MTAAELIAKLKLLPANTEVMVFHGEMVDYFPLGLVRRQAVVPYGRLAPDGWTRVGPRSKRTGKKQIIALE